MLILISVFNAVFLVLSVFKLFKNQELFMVKLSEFQTQMADLGAGVTLLVTAGGAVSTDVRALIVSVAALDSQIQRLKDQIANQDPTDPNKIEVPQEMEETLLTVRDQVNAATESLNSLDDAVKAVPPPPADGGEPADTDAGTDQSSSSTSPPAA